MTQAPAMARDRLSVWCGWVLASLLAVTPVIAWLGPLGFAPLVALAGLLCLPAVRIEEEDRPLVVAVLVAVIWAAGSMIWSPFKPSELEETTGLKLVAMATFFWALICGARRASLDSRRAILQISAWGVALLGLIMLVEGLSGAKLYQAMRDAIGDPIRPDLAAKNVAVASFVLAVLWAPAAVAGARACRAPWLALPMIAGLIGGSSVNGADAPLAAGVLGLVAGLAVWRWPIIAPRVLAGIAAFFFLLAPLLIWAVRAAGLYGVLEQAAPVSWAQRMSYWRHAVDWIADHPMRGWGLDASRMFGPGIQLHPHDSALQIWLELGVIGAVAAAVFWVALFARLSRPKPDLAVAAAAAAATAYMVIGAVSFGVWQEWWLAIGALCAALCAVLLRAPAAGSGGRNVLLGAQTSTIRPVSE